MTKTTYDPEKFQLSIARLKKGSENFEVVIEPNNLVSYKEGKLSDVDEVVTSQDIFFDAQKGQLASEAKVQAVFGNKQPLEIAKIIIDTGALHLGMEYKRMIREKKRKQVIQLIHKNAIDPKTKTPHSLSRIESAMEEAKVRIDELRTPSAQVKDIVRQMQSLLPLSFEQKEIRVHVSQKYAHACVTAMQRLGTLTYSNWGGDGSFTGTVLIPGGLEDELYSTLNSLSHGSIVTEIVQVKKL